MRRLLGLFVIGVILGACLYAGGVIEVPSAPAGVMLLGGGTPALSTTTTTASSYNDIILWWRCEATTLDGTYDHTHGDNEATLNPSAALNTDAVKLGTNGLDIPTSLDWARFTVSSQDIIDTDTTCRIGFWIYFNTFNDSAIIFAIHSATGGKYISIGLDTTSGNDIVLVWRDGAIKDVTYDTNLSTATWYFLELRIDQAASERQLFINGSSISTDTNAFTGLSDEDYFSIGNTSGNANDSYMDHIIISNDDTRDLNALSATQNFPG